MKPANSAMSEAIRSPDPVMDRWIQRHLRIIYEDTVDEPLPPQLVELVEKIGQRIGQI